MRQTGLRRRFGLNVLAVLRSADRPRATPSVARLSAGDRLLVQARADALEALRDGPEFDAVRAVRPDELESLLNCVIKEHIKECVTS